MPSPAADPLQDYLPITNFNTTTNFLSTPCARLQTSAVGFPEAVSLELFLSDAGLELSQYSLINYRPLIGCEDILEFSFNSIGEVDWASFRTNEVSIDRNLTDLFFVNADFSNLRKPIWASGTLVFDLIDYGNSITKDCADLDKNTIEVSPNAYARKILEMLEETETRSVTKFIDDPNNDPNEKTQSGPVTHWFFEAAIEYEKMVSVNVFSDFILTEPEIIISYSNYLEYKQALCAAYLGDDSKTNLYIEASRLTSFGTNFSGHTANWPQFEYVETGRNIIPAPSPAGLEYYKKYTTGGGVIIVAGQNVDDQALLAARDAFIWMTSSRKEMRGILQQNHARIALFLESSAELPEFANTEGEIGGFAQTRSDATMTANATWLCYPGNLVVSANPAIHELGHTINHLIFEEVNETYWYDLIIPLANAARNSGVMPVESPLGEYWAQAVEGYVMNKGDGFSSLFPTRSDIAIQHPGLYSLLTRYFPIELWDYCPGVED